MASDADEGWNAAAICQALRCPGCPDCRDDDSDQDWDGKDEEPGDDAAGLSWVCINPHCPDETCWVGPGTCRCGDELTEIDRDGHEVT